MFAVLRLLSVGVTVFSGYKVWGKLQARSRKFLKKQNRDLGKARSRMIDYELC